MRIDKNKLQELSMMDDARLWETIRELAAGHGISIPEKAPASSEMQKLRSLMQSDKINPLLAMRILKSIKGGHR